MTNTGATMTNEAIMAAVNWWADKLESCKQSGLSAEERSNPANRSYELAEMLMDLNKPKVNATQIDNFKDKLLLLIMEKKPYCLSVDYGPDIILREALAQSRIPVEMGTLPIKTVMWLDEKEGVQVRYGYGAEIETIYPAQAEVEP